MRRAALAMSIFLAGTCLLTAQSRKAGQPSFEKQGYESPLPVLLETGTYQYGTTNGYGYWRGADATLWLRGNARFTPIFQFNSQTRPTGTQQNYGFLSFANWSPNFYTTQGVSFSPSRPGAAWFPNQRVDFKAHYKVPWNRRFLLTSGLTHYRFDSPIHGNLYSAGFLYYFPKLIVEGNYYLNHNQPNHRIGHSGTLSAQYGREGRYWVGATVGGGKEVYTYIVETPLEVNLNGVSTTLFFRKWFNRHYGIYAAYDQQTKFGAFSRHGGIGRMFFEF